MTAAPRRRGPFKVLKRLFGDASAMTTDGAAPSFAPAPATLAGAPTGPLPRGLTGWLARVADRASNGCDRRDMAFAPDVEAVLTEAWPPLVDLHSDTLLWGVDPWERRSSGHMDLPRLFDARVGLQVFGGPTWTPLPMKNREQALCVSCESIDQSDALFPSEWLDRLRRNKGVERRRRAFKLAHRFHEMLRADHGGRLRPVYRAEDLDGLRPLGATGARPGALGVMLSLEGVHWIEPQDSAEAVRAEIASLRAAGYRMIAPTHRFANGLGGSSEDCNGRRGLTPAGRRMLAACFELGVAVDLAHASPALIREAAGLALNFHGGVRPLIVSHAGIRGSCRAARNLRDADIRAVASTGGLIGVGMWMEAIGFDASAPYEMKAAAIVDAFEAALTALQHEEFVEEMQDRYGRYDPYEHLAFGSDFDGATLTPFDVTGLSWLLAALMARRRLGGESLLPLEKAPLVAGGNALRVLGTALTPAEA